MRGRGILLALFCLSACAACGGPAGPPPDPFALKIAQDGKGYDLTTGEYLPPLEGGRLEVAPPKGWTVRPRTSDYLLKLDKGGSLPRIDMTQEPSSYEDFSTLTKDNVVAFAKLRDEQFLAEGKPLLEPPKPMIIGGTPCVRYVVPIRASLPTGSVMAERQVIETIHDNELYSVNLLILEGDILSHRDAAYAVASSLKFHEVEGGGSVFDNKPDRPMPQVPTLEDVTGKKSDDKKSDDKKKNNPGKGKADDKTAPPVDQKPKKAS